MEADFANGSYPEDHPLYAPGIHRRDRGTWVQAFWMAPEIDVRAGFTPSMVKFQHREPEIEMAAKCRSLQLELLRWRQPRNGLSARARQWRYKKAPPLPDISEYDGQDGVYFVQCQNPDRFVKIGYSTDFKPRFTDLMTSCPYPIRTIGNHRGPKALETYLHYHFRFERVHGEWFSPTKELLYAAHALPLLLKKLVGREQAKCRPTWHGENGRSHVPTGIPND